MRGVEADTAHNIMPPKDTSAMTTVSATAAQTDSASHSLRRSPRLAAFCLGIDLFEAEALPQLSNCSRDAHHLALHLWQAVPTAQTSVRNLVHCCDNVTRLEFESAFSNFESQLAESSASAETPDIVIVFLASHGFQIDSEIFVALKDTAFGELMRAEPHRYLTECCIDVTRLIHRIKLGYSGPLALILDTCRSSPIPNLALHLNSLANRIDYPSNTLVCFSTSAGGAAADGGPMHHSPFFLALIQKLTVAEVSVRSAIDAACNLLGPDQGSVCVTFQFKDICLVPKMMELLVIGGPSDAQKDVAGQVRLLNSARERQSGRSGRIVVLSPRDGSIPADVLALCTHAGIPRFDFPLSNDDIATIVSIWDLHSSAGQHSRQKYQQEKNRSYPLTLAVN